MSDATILSELCATCHNAIPKYTCPGCSSKTCSAKCHNRHKKIAQCSGKRDCTAFVSQAKLTTPAGIDHDYNYLTSIERAITKANEDAQRRGVDYGRENKRLTDRLQSLNVKFHRMPTGMSRHRENHTKWNHKIACIIWTIEWFHPGWKRRVTHTPETATVEKTYLEVLHANESTKRKRMRNQWYRDNKKKQRQILNVKQYIKGVKAVLRANAVHGVKNGSATDAPVEDVDDAQDECDSGDGSSVDIQTEPSEQSCPSTGQPEAPPSVHFYLLKPLTKGTTKVLIPVQGHKRLTDVIQGKEILEYPTIHVREGDEEGLPDGFQLEEEYNKELARLKQENDDELKAAGIDVQSLIAQSREAREVQVGFETDVSASDVAASLRRDMGK